jgi:hypothetical protein
MNPQLILTVTVLCAVLAGCSFVSSLVLFARTRRRFQDWVALGTELNTELADLSRDLDSTSRQSGEHSRKLAWLEARARSRETDARLVDETVPAVSSKPNITERRHRVLSLSRRGQDPKTIARTLGMPHGEVELMINLVNAA